MIDEETGKIQWDRIFMGFAVALVFIMQSYHAMQVADLKDKVVPRVEYTAHRDRTMDKDMIMQELHKLEARLNNMENRDGTKN